MEMSSNLTLGFRLLSTSAAQRRSDQIFKPFLTPTLILLLSTLLLLFCERILEENIILLFCKSFCNIYVSITYSVNNNYGYSKYLFHVQAI